MNDQPALFSHRPNKHAALIHRQRSRPEDFRRRVAAVLRAFAPAAIRRPCRLDLGIDEQERAGGGAA